MYFLRSKGLTRDIVSIPHMHTQEWDWCLSMHPAFLGVFLIFHKYFLQGECTYKCGKQRNSCCLDAAFETTAFRSNTRSFTFKVSMKLCCVKLEFSGSCTSSVTANPLSTSASQSGHKILRFWNHSDSNFCVSIKWVHDFQNGLPIPNKKAKPLFYSNMFCWTQRCL